MILTIELAQSLNLGNVEFQCADFRNLNRKFDTLFMSKVSQEIVNFYDVNWNQSRQKLVESFEKKFYSFAKIIRGLLNDSGTLMTIDRIPYIIAIYGYYKAFAKAGISVDINTYCKIIFLSLGEREEMPFITGRVGAYDLHNLELTFEKALDDQEIQARMG